MSASGKDEKNMTKDIKLSTIAPKYMQVYIDKI